MSFEKKYQKSEPDVLNKKREKLNTVDWTKKGPTKTHDSNMN